GVLDRAAGPGLRRQRPADLDSTAWAAPVSVLTEASDRRVEPPTLARPHVEVEGLVVRRGGRTTLEVPSLAIARGEILAVVGPNGAGKSTLVAALALLNRPAAGLIRFDGVSVDWGRGSLQARRRLALV